MSYLKDELAGFVPKETASEIVKQVVRGSSVMRLGKAEAMTSDTKKIPVMTSGAGAYWVGEGQRISTSGAEWIWPEITAKKLAVIIPITKEKLEDSTIDVFSELEETIAEAFYKAFDAAAIFATGSPFATSIMGAINEKNATVTVSSNNPFDLAASDVMAIIEDAGYEVDGFAARIGIKNTLRKLRDANGAPIFVPGTDQSELYSQPIEFVRNGAWQNSQADIIAGNWKYALVGIRDDISYEILKEATLQGTLDADGKPISLAEQDMVAIKATMRVGFLCVKPEAFAALVPATAAAATPDCTLSSLTIGALTLSPEFNSATTAYTATTSNNTNTITAAATATGATIAITVGETTVENGSAATWASGANTVTITVTNGSASKVYTVTVTKE